MSKLAVVSCHFNPCGFRAPLRNWWRWYNHLPRGLDVVSVELSFDGTFQTDSQIKLRGDINKHCLWQKECLLNIAIENLPAEVDRVAWIDADCMFHDADWVERTNRQLDQFPAVQMYAAVNMLAADGSVERHAKSVMANDGRQRPRENRGPWAKPGLAWAARRDVLSRGLYDRMVVGAGDVAFLHAAQGDFGGYYFADRKRTNAAQQRDWLAWGPSVYCPVRRRIGYVDTVVDHLYHGSTPNRQYAGREATLIDHGYDPAVHVAKNDEGVLGWTDAAPEAMRRGVREYFRNRREDE